MCTCGECLSRRINGQHLNPAPAYNAELALAELRVALFAAVQRFEGSELTQLRELLEEVSDAFDLEDEDLQKDAE
jgi:hypothetical protein